MSDVSFHGLDPSVKFGLVGEKLGHSFSKIIHEWFGDKSYSFVETADLRHFLDITDFDGFNVTVPYKETIIPLLDELDPIASRLGSVNAVVRQNGKFIGYNTDYFGFKSLLDYHHINLVGQRVLLVGNGGVAKTVEAVLIDGGAFVTRIVRTKKRSSDVLIEAVDKPLLCDIIVNTTPVGMYPENAQDFPLKQDYYQSAKVAIDLIYNPIQTAFLLKAKDRGMLTIDGLYMLVMQAKQAFELFHNKILPLSLANKIHHNLKRRVMNIVLVGLPLSGKSMFGKHLARIYDKNFVDTDNTIEEAQHKTIEQMFIESGESAFRFEEEALINRLYKTGGRVIATGGGMIENPRIMALLKQNGVIVYLVKNPDHIANLEIKGRPLMKSPEDVMKLYHRRKPLYEGNADVIVKVDATFETNLETIEALLNEYFDR